MTVERFNGRKAGMETRAMTEKTQVHPDAARLIRDVLGNRPGVRVVSEDGNFGLTRYRAVLTVNGRDATAFTSYSREHASGATLFLATLSDRALMELWLLFDDGVTS